MGALQCEVKVLRDSRPLLFSWENPVKKLVECILVTCPCQKLDLEHESVDDVGGGPFPAEDGAWVSRLLSSLENAEVVSFASLDECRTLFSPINGGDGSPKILSGEQMEKLPKRGGTKYRPSWRGQRNEGTLGMSNIDVLIAGLKCEYKETMSDQSADTLSTKCGPGNKTGGTAIDGSSLTNRDAKEGNSSVVNSQSRGEHRRSTDANRRGNISRGRGVSIDKQMPGRSVVYNILKGLSGSIFDITGGASESLSEAGGESHVSSGDENGPDRTIGNLDGQSSSNRTVPPDHPRGVSRRIENTTEPLLRTDRAASGDNTSSAEGLGSQNPGKEKLPLPAVSERAESNPLTISPIENDKSDLPISGLHSDTCSALSKPTKPVSPVHSPPREGRSVHEGEWDLDSTGSIEGPSSECVGTNVGCVPTMVVQEQKAIGLLPYEIASQPGVSLPSQTALGGSKPVEGARKEITQVPEAFPVSWMECTGSNPPFSSEAGDSVVLFHEMPEASTNLVIPGECSGSKSSLTGSRNVDDAAAHSTNAQIQDYFSSLDESTDLSRSKRLLDISSHHSAIDIHTIDPEIRGAALNLASLENLVLSEHFASTDGADSALPEENALMKAIDSMIQTMSSQSSGQSIPSQAGATPVVHDPENTSTSSVPSTRVEFIRNLTDEERKKMFNFRSDIDERNRRALEAGEGAYLCEHCGRVLSLKAIRGHMKTHEKNRERRHICDICDKAFLSNFARKNHLKTHDPNTTYNCRHCPKIYKSKFGRTMHERLHFRVYPEECVKCGDKFNESHKLKLHMEKVHGDEHARPRKAVNRKTQKSDRGTKTCPICNKVLRAMSFRQHMEMHNGRMFTCPTCGKVMRHATRFAHLKLHTLKKDFKCSHCEKSFVSKQSLTNHERTHTGERHLKCRYCDRMFGRYSSREVHENAHTGARPYKCTICDKAWKDRSSYRTHMYKKHPGEPLFYKRRTAEINSKRGPNWVLVSNAE